MPRAARSKPYRSLAEAIAVVGAFTSWSRRRRAWRGARTSRCPTRSGTGSRDVHVYPADDHGTAPTRPSRQRSVGRGLDSESDMDHSAATDGILGLGSVSDLTSV